MAIMGGSAGIDRLPATDTGIEYQKGRGAGMIKERQDPVIRALEKEKRILQKEIDRLEYLLFKYNPLQEKMEVYKDMVEASHQGDYKRAMKLAERHEVLDIEVKKNLRQDPCKQIDQLVRKEIERDEIANEIFLRQIRMGGLR